MIPHTFKATIKKLQKPFCEVLPTFFDLLEKIGRSQCHIQDDNLGHHPSEQKEYPCCLFFQANSSHAFERLVRYFSNPLIQDGEVVLFSQYVVDEMLPPTIWGKPKWWKFLYWPMILDLNTSATLQGLNPNSTVAPSAMPYTEWERLPPAAIVLLHIVSTLICHLLLALPTYYDLIEVQASGTNPAASVETLIIQMRGKLNTTAP